MNRVNEMISALRKCAKEHENEVGYTGQVMTSSLCRDVADYLEADKWHYPSRGEYPEPDERDICMCLKTFGWRGSTYRTFETGYWSGKGFVDQRANEIKDEVVAWQYIIPPKEEA